ncbi:pyridoxal 5'-phosphate synthase glutaminase subunit PdxT [Shimazuella soli]|uniref:pyridoxal 5'-phosphate synthase glutaminase subunit PdxT n=1 Tax=Shimazuella soli TaxID=1892854 RepID=UPI0030B84417
MKVGVLALQGAVREHIQILDKLGVEAVAVKRKEQLVDVDGLIIPGGESTTIGKLLRQYDLQAPILEFHAKGKPIFGTCAGLIIIAKHITENNEPHLPLLNVTVQRNAFGRQVDSFEADLPIKDVAEDFQAVFIRAPLITEVGADVEVLSTVKDQVVAVKQENLLGISFHPELTDDTRLHAYFLNMVKKAIEKHQ